MDRQTVMEKLVSATNEYAIGARFSRVAKTVAAAAIIAKGFLEGEISASAEYVLSVIEATIQSVKTLAPEAEKNALLVVLHAIKNIVRGDALNRSGAGVGLISVEMLTECNRLAA